MPSVQKLLFPDPQPLVERFGRDFFRSLPEGPGVYLMRDAADVVVYVGKAKNLRRRLGSYRAANPDRVKRRRLRLLNTVARIELQECPDERAALAKEAELLQTLRPKFNRAGTWRPAPRFMAWRCAGQEIHLTITQSPDPEWRFYGPLGGGAEILRASVARLLWIAVHPTAGFTALPLGWSHGRLRKETVLDCGVLIEPIAWSLEGLVSGRAGPFQEWIRSRLPDDLCPFELSCLEADFELIADRFQMASLQLQAVTCINGNFETVVLG